MTSRPIGSRPMTRLAWLVLIAAMVALLVVAGWSALYLSPWALLAWPASMVLLTVLCLIVPGPLFIEEADEDADELVGEPDEPEAVVEDVVPPCDGCESPLCPDCAPVRDETGVDRG